MCNRNKMASICRPSPKPLPRCNPPKMRCQKIQMNACGQNECIGYKEPSSNKSVCGQQQLNGGCRQQQNHQRCGCGLQKANGCGNSTPPPDPCCGQQLYRQNAPQRSNCCGQKPQNNCGQQPNRQRCKNQTSGCAPQRPNKCCQPCSQNSCEPERRSPSINQGIGTTVNQSSKSPKQSNFLNNVMDVVDTIIEILTICGISQCKATKLKEVILTSFLVFDEKPGGENEIFKRNFRKCNFFNDLAMHASTSGTESLQIYAIVKYAFKAFYYRQSFRCYNPQYIDECQWKKVARKTLESYTKLNKTCNPTILNSVEALITTTYNGYVQRFRAQAHELELESLCNNKHNNNNGCNNNNNNRNSRTNGSMCECKQKAAHLLDCVQKLNTNCNKKKPKNFPCWTDRSTQLRKKCKPKQPECERKSMVTRTIKCPEKRNNMSCMPSCEMNYLDCNPEPDDCTNGNGNGNGNGNNRNNKSFTNNNKDNDNQNNDGSKKDGKQDPNEKSSLFNKDDQTDDKSSKSKEALDEQNRKNQLEKNNSGGGKKGDSDKDNKNKKDKDKDNKDKDGGDKCTFDEDDPRYTKALVRFFRNGKSNPEVEIILKEPHDLQRDLITMNINSVEEQIPAVYAVKNE